MIDRIGAVSNGDVISFNVWPQGNVTGTVRERRMPNQTVHFTLDTADGPLKFSLYSGRKVQYLETAS